MRGGWEWVVFVRSFVAECGEELENVHLTTSRVLLLVAAELSIEKPGQMDTTVRSLHNVTPCAMCAPAVPVLEVVSRFSGAHTTRDGKTLGRRAAALLVEEGEHV